MTETKFARPKMKEHSPSPARMFRRYWLFAAWVFIILLTLYLYAQSTAFIGMVGVIHTPEEPIVSLQTARLKNINVDVGDRVKAGDVVAQMDTLIIDAEMDQAKAEMAEAENTMESYQTAILQAVMSFDREVTAAIADLKEQESLLERDKATLAELKKEQARRDALVARKFINEADANALKPQIAGLEKMVDHYPSLIKMYEAQVEEAKARRLDLNKTMRITDSGNTAEAIKVKTEARLDILKNTIRATEIERETYTLKATRDGIVSEIFNMEGDIISSGQPILKLVGERTDTVIGFLAEVHLSEINENDTVFVARERGAGKSHKGVVQSIAPEIDTMPTRMSPIQGQTTRGRRVMIKLNDDHDFVPGETVNIRSARSIFSVMWERAFGS